MIKKGQNQSSEIIRKNHDAKFLVCNSCLWCASWLAGDNYFERCPTCTSERLELIPIAETEAYRMNIDGNGFSIEFWNEKKQFLFLNGPSAKAQLEYIQFALFK